MHSKLLWYIQQDISQNNKNFSPKKDKKKNCKSHLEYEEVCYLVNDGTERYNEMSHQICSPVYLFQ